MSVLFSKVSVFLACSSFSVGFMAGWQGQRGRKKKKERTPTCLRVLSTVQNVTKVIFQLFLAFPGVQYSSFFQNGQWCDLYAIFFSSGQGKLVSNGQRAKMWPNFAPSLQPTRNGAVTLVRAVGRETGCKGQQFT